MSNDFNEIKQWKIEVLDSKSKSFCGAKWYNSSMWLFSGTTTSCHHNPVHNIDLEAIKTNPRALHNTPIKQEERRMMKAGEKPLNCQFCWVMEEADPEGLADRTWLSRQATDSQLQAAFDAPPEQDFDLTYLEVAFDRTCNIGCAYCGPSVSSTWVKDIKKNGPYELKTDHRNYYGTTWDQSVLYDYNDTNPYAEAFFKWWDSGLYKTMKQLRITGGEPMMSGHTWRLMEWLKKNPKESDFRLEMTTNLNYDRETLDRFLDYCKEINNPVWIFTSGESFGAQAEYVRNGLDWKQWVSNLEYVTQHPAIQGVHVIGTIGAPGIDSYVEFLEFILELKKRPETKELHISTNLVRFPTFQNVVILSQELRELYASDLEAFVSNPEVPDYFKVYELDNITRLIRYLRTVENPHREQQKKHDSTTYEQSNYQVDVGALQRDFKQFIEQFNQRRNSNFSAAFPRLKEWYNTL